MQVFLETQRLVLRRFSVDDADNLVDLDADPDVMRFITGGVPTSRDEIENEFLPAFLGYYERYEGLRLVRTFHQPWPYPIEGDQFGDVEYVLDKADWQQQDHADAIDHPPT